MSMLRPIAAVATAVALLAACDSEPAASPVSSPSTEPESEGTGARIEAVPPPEDIPRAWWESGSGAERVPGERVYSSWFVDGELQEATAEGVADDVQAPATDRVTIELATGVPPVRVDLLLYDELSASGTPTGVIDEYECALTDTDPGDASTAEPGGDDAEGEADSDTDCSYRTGDHVEVAAALPPETRVVIVNAGWYIPSEEREANKEPSPEVSASWAFVVEKDG
ncbi:hypothetical protein CDO52_22520 [Nocardiopsis gilva YIM 90087]|uniref:Lipoprotein n=1 Tax=Nocardiopsis gilva YIM 90087 TaxID=1235441 RepID=A0A223SAT9_9ACTN|nr:hypothetical protein [Nocardiopsis gilva]ASU85196.1 hypothetical protein CDO52_22520 [Nocardiopsis gilva YIM 90087]